MQLFIDLGDFCLSEGVDLLVGETLQRQMLISLVLFLFYRWTHCVEQNSRPREEAV